MLHFHTHLWELAMELLENARHDPKGHGSGHPEHDSPDFATGNTLGTLDRAIERREHVLASL